MIKAILVFNNHGKPRMSKFYQYFVSTERGCSSVAFDILEFVMDFSVVKSKLRMVLLSGCNCSVDSIHVCIVKDAPKYGS
jgi:hypothetical protein